MEGSGREAEGSSGSAGAASSAAAHTGMTAAVEVGTATHEREAEAMKDSTRVGRRHLQGGARRVAAGHAPSATARHAERARGGGGGATESAPSAGTAAGRAGND
eukprot:5071831-Prymnesium_polylepis.1